MSNIEQYNNEIFEKIKNINEYGQEFWYARELQEVLEYKRWDKFTNVIDKAKETCKNSDVEELDHFYCVGKMVEIGSGSERKDKGVSLTFM